MVLPLVTTDAVSDSENIDDEEQILNDRSAFLLYEIAGHIELSCAYNEDSPNVQPIDVSSSKNASGLTTHLIETIMR